MDHGPWTMDPTDIITVSNTDGEIKEIEQLDVTMARKTFGVMPSPNGDKSAEPWQSFLNNASSQLEFAPTDVESFGFEDLVTAQLAEHVLILLDHGNDNTVPCQLSRISSEGTFVETVFGGDLCAMPHKSITWTTYTWLRNTLLGISSLNFFNDTELSTRNEVKIMLLQVTTVSDITSSDGKSFLTSFHKHSDTFMQFSTLLMATNINPFKSNKKSHGFQHFD
eukprot:scaffold3835_cov295-Chaetoceros_neogracile.AAC.22